MRKRMRTELAAILLIVFLLILYVIVPVRVYAATVKTERMERYSTENESTNTDEMCQIIQKRYHLLQKETIMIWKGEEKGIGATEEDGITYEYDELNRVVQATYPDGTVITYEYDKNGNITQTQVIPPETTAEENSSGSFIENDSVIVDQTIHVQQQENNGFNSDTQESNGKDSSVEENENESENGDVQERNTEEGTEKETEENEKMTILPWILVTVLATGGVIWGVNRRKKHEK